MKSRKAKMEVSSPEYRDLVQNLLGKKVEFAPGTSLPSLPKVLIMPSPSPSRSPIKEKKHDFSGVKDVDKMILLNLDIESLRNVCQVNKYALEICNDKSFWRNKIVKDFPLRGKFIWYTEYRNLYKNNPKQLYEIINGKSKIVSLTEKDYPSLAKEFDEDDEFSKEDLRMINKKILPNLNKLPLLRGDIIHLAWVGEYRNSGKLIWTGERVVELDTNIDEYGSVPKEFSFPEFPIDYFYDSIDHNNLIWISQDKVQEIIKNFDEKTQKSFVTDLYKSIPVIAGAKDDDDKLVRLTKQQFAEYITKFPFFDDNIHNPEFGEKGTAVVGAWFGGFDRLHDQSEEESSSEDEEIDLVEQDEVPRRGVRTIQRIRR